MTYKRGDRVFSHYTFKFGSIQDDADTEHWGEEKTARRKSSWDGWYHVKNDDDTITSLDSSRLMTEEAGQRWLSKQANDSAHADDWQHILDPLRRKDEG